MTIVPSQALAPLLKQVRACAICSAHLPLGPRPVLQVSARAKILIAGQAPGRRVHESGVLFDDASGDRLREWMGVERISFYDDSQIAILPMGFCYPGAGTSGDLPPRRECAPAWRTPLMAQMERVELTLVIGAYALAWHLPAATGSLTDVVRNWKLHWPTVLPLPHPSPRNNVWLSRNPWFAMEVLPSLRQRVAAVLAGETAQRHDNP